MGSGLFDFDGSASAVLTGIECRILRGLLSLERRHVAILADVVAPGSQTSTARVGQWERSKGRGYPPALVVLLRDLVEEVAGRGRTLSGLTTVGPDGRWTLRVPPADDMRQLLANIMERDLSPAEATALDNGGGDFWQRLADAVVIEAARIGAEEDRPVHVA